VSLRLPFGPPYDAATYPVAEPYQASNPDPAAWRLRIAVERPASAGLDLIACIDGLLSTVPPGELPPDWYGLATLPDGQQPAVTRLYLQPAGPQQLGSWGEALATARLGSAVSWFVYENVDATALASAVTSLVDKYPGFAGLTLHGKKLTSAQRLEAFLEGQVSVYVTAGTVLGPAAASSTSGQLRAQFGVRTDRGYVDPVTFFGAMADQLDDGASLDSFTALITSPWPVLGTATDPDALLAAATAQLYPLPVLMEAGERLGQLTSDPYWRQLADRQKALYWPQLAIRAGFDLPGTPFTFSTDDMANPFQLEAVTEFYMLWGTSGHPGAITLDPPSAVDLLAGAWNLVFIDPFDHDFLGHPEPPRPDYSLAFYPKQPAWCDPKNTPLPVPDPADPATTHPLPADFYRAVLFVLHSGRVAGWYRWSTYTSHMWEDKNRSNCGQSSSIQGNLPYAFTSRTSPIPLNDDGTVDEDKVGSSHHRNYNFALADLDPVRNPPVKGVRPLKAPGRFYFRPGEPPDDGTQPGDTRKGKELVLVHNGYAIHNKNTAQYTTGSGGCLVSPEFYSMRAQIVALYESDYRISHQNQDDPDLLPLMNLDLAGSEALHAGQITTGGVPYRDEQWDGKIAGTMYLVRPDEPSQK
jgi:hypothetical protein